MKLRAGGVKSNYQTSTAAAGFVAGVVVTLMLSAVHHKHSEAHLEASSRQLPGQLLESSTSGAGTAGTTAAAGHAAKIKTGGSSWLHVVIKKPPPPPSPAKLQPPDLDTVRRLMVSFGNSAYFEMVQNWARLVMQTGAPFLIAAFDDSMLAKCEEQGLPCVKVELGVHTSDFRGDFATFRKMGAIKVQFVSDLLEQHASLEMVVVSDSDCVWLREPWQYLALRNAADFFVSTDCLSVKVEDEWKPEHQQPRCGHVAGNHYGRAFNTGLFAAHNTPAARAFLKAWAGMLTDPAREQHTDEAHRGIDDQMALNLLFEAGGIVGAGDKAPRAIKVFNRSLTVQTLPVVLFSNGHVAFVQRTPWKLGVTPMVIHTTFQRYLGPGKTARLREFGFWHMDPPQYYGQLPKDQEGAALGRLAANNEFLLKALAYDGENEVLAFVEEAERQRYSGKGHGMPPFEKHWVGMSYQLAAFRDALAAARMLGRTLLLPTLWCWCDLDESPDVLDSCRMKGSDLELPFQCPLDFLLPIKELDASGVDYRPAGFLQLPQVPVTLRKAKSAVQIASARPDNPFPVPSHTVGHAVQVWPGIKQGELVQAVEPVKGEAVLQLRGRVPGFLGGFDGVGDSSTFDQLFQQATTDYGDSPFWCCMSWGDTDTGPLRKMYYQLPQPLAAGWKPWELPVLTVPDWCDRVSTRYNNDQWTRLPNHPCAFMRNETAAVIAAGTANDSSMAVSWAALGATADTNMARTLGGA